MGNVFGRVGRQRRIRRRLQMQAKDRQHGFHFRLHGGPANAPAAVSDAETDAINALVDQFLADELINNRFIPDAVERRMYCNVIKMIIGILKVSIDHASLEAFGHRFVMNMTPIPVHHPKTMVTNPTFCESAPS
jgi:hypothetical protein